MSCICDVRLVNLVGVTKPLLQSMGSQRVGHDLVTEQQSPRIGYHMEFCCFKVMNCTIPLVSCWKIHKKRLLVVDSE